MKSDEVRVSESARDRESQPRHVDDLLPSFVNGSLDRLQAERVRVHLTVCASCQTGRQAWEAIRHASQASVASTPAPSADILSRVWNEIERDDARRRFMLVTNSKAGPISLVDKVKSMLQPERQPSRRSFLRPLSVAAAGAAIIAAVALTPIGSFAQGFLTIFTPRQFAAVPVTQAELQSLPNLDSYGTYTNSPHVAPRSASTAAAASTIAGFTVAVPGSLPASVTGAPSYRIVGGQSASFTFSAAKAKATAAQKGMTLPPMPANIDGSTVQVTTGSAVLTTYGGNIAKYSSADPTVVANLKVKETAKAGTGSSVNLANLPSLVIGQTKAPVVTSTGASATDLEAYLLAQPGIDPNLAAAIKAIGDPTTVLPIPVPTDKATSHSIQVQGVTGISVADSTGIGGGIIWLKGGMVYGVAGPLTENDLLIAANSLQ